MSESPRTLQLDPSIDLAPLRTWVRERLLPVVNGRGDATSFPVEIYQELHALGWLQAFVPAEYGGGGLQTRDLVFVARELAYASMGVVTSTMVNVLALAPVMYYGSEALREELCSRFSSRFTLASYCMTEPDAGSNLLATRTTAKRVPGGYRLSGKKCFITNANHAEILNVYAVMEGSKLGKGGTMFYVPASAEGVTRGAAMRKLGQRESNTGELFFDDVFVPDEHRIGEEGQGLEIAFRSLQKSKTLIGAGSVGICDRAQDLVTEHLATRNITGLPLLTMQTVHSLLADLHTEVNASWLLTLQSAARWDTGAFAIKEASMAKMYASNTAVRVVNESLELFGGSGYSTELEIERLHRDAKLLEIYEGPTLVQLVLIAKELFPQHAGPALRSSTAA